MPFWCPKSDLDILSAEYFHTIQPSKTLSKEMLRPSNCPQVGRNSLILQLPAHFQSVLFSYPCNYTRAEKNPVISPITSKLHLQSSSLENRSPISGILGLKADKQRCPCQLLGLGI